MATFLKRLVSWKYFGIVLVLGIFLDHLFKYFSLNYWRFEPWVIIDGFAGFSYSENIGIAFGIPIPAAILIPLSILLLIFFVVIMSRELDMKKLWSQFFLGFIIAGGVGNFIDRIVRGFVVDFIEVGAFPVFNIADVLIVVGAIGTFLFYGKLKVK